MGNVVACRLCCANALVDETFGAEFEGEAPHPWTLKGEKHAGSRHAFPVTLKRIGSHWNNIGFVVSPDDSPTYLMIDETWAPSLLSEWNERQESKDTKVRPGDMVVSVNGQSTKSEHMILIMKQVSKGGDITLVIEPGPEPFHAASSSGPPAAREHTSASARHCKSKRRAHAELQRHFAVLDIAESSSDEAIRLHYKRLARLWHPDKNRENQEEATAKFQAINAAYDAIKAKLHL